jgi:hypothetical protein
MCQLALGRLKFIQLRHLYQSLEPLKLKLLLGSRKGINRHCWSDPTRTESSRKETLCSKIYRLIKLIWNKEELPHLWKESIVLPIHEEGNETDCSNYPGILLSTSYKILSNILLSRLTPYTDEMIGVTSVDFNVIDQRLIWFSISVRYWRKCWSIMVPQLFIDARKHDLLLISQIF